MKHPVWTLSEVRDTNAPFARVVQALRPDTECSRLGSAAWHPRLKGAPFGVEEDSPTRLRLGYVWKPFPGVEERGSLEAEAGERCLLRHEARFRGWPVLLLMGWWRIRTHRMWERLVRSL